MNENFKLLIAYDGSKYADSALDDLKSAGLPRQNVDAYLLTVAEVWLPPANFQAETQEPENFITESVRKSTEKNLKILEEAKNTASRAAERVRANFPGWRVEAGATYGSPGWEVLAKASDFQSDLILVGACGRTALEKIWLGSVSQKIVTEAECSVRVARGKIETDESPARIIVAYDGTPGAQAAVSSVAARKWLPETDARVVIVEDTGMARDSFAPERAVLEEAGARAVNELEKAGLRATLVITEGNPKQRIVQLAENWQADAIFVGATRFASKIERFLLGSVSSAITARAHCSVEVVRPNFYKSKS